MRPCFTFFLISPGLLNNKGTCFTIPCSGVKDDRLTSSWSLIWRIRKFFGKFQLICPRSPICRGLGIPPSESLEPKSKCVFFRISQDKNLFHIPVIFLGSSFSLKWLCLLFYCFISSIFLIFYLAFKYQSSIIIYMKHKL